MDEDTCATNFMIRDFRMQLLVSKDKEPITPFLAKVRAVRYCLLLPSLPPSLPSSLPHPLKPSTHKSTSCWCSNYSRLHRPSLSLLPPSLPPSLPQVQALYNQHGVSSLLVIGGAGDYFDVATTVIMMDSYEPLDKVREPVLPSLPPSLSPFLLPSFLPSFPSIQAGRDILHAAFLDKAIHFCNLSSLPPSLSPLTPSLPPSRPPSLPPFSSTRPRKPRPSRRSTPPTRALPSSPPTSAHSPAASLSPPPCTRR